ncbi:MAG TPA: signal peptide peptidase SppA [Blastocatellia bacterium]|nr:signal peptide peptidase SppA [Blastocatellia bacterium]
MRKFIVRLLAVIGALSILFVIAIFGFFLLSWSSKPGVPGKVILELNLETGLIEAIPNDPIANIMLSDVTTVRDIVDGLERAGNDERVAGVIARLGGTTTGMAQSQEIRDAIINFRSKNKFAIAFAETFGEVGPGTGSYYLATSFDQIYLQPSGDIGLTGIIMEGQFVKGTLEKLGVQPRMDNRYEYKAAMYTFTEKQFTPAHREEMEAIMNSWFSQITRGIAEGRRMNDQQVRALVDKGPFLGQEAVDAGLVDKLAYRDEVYAEAKSKAGDRAEFLYMNKYLDRAGRPHQSGQTIALVYGVGGVTRGKSGYSPVTGDINMGSDSVAAALRAAIEDKNVKAIIFRVDSPGGSYVASDTIWRETIRAKQAGKPVIVSMGDLAGSGGYFVAMAADKIVAQPGTITGSIGVLGGKMLTNGFWDKVGISWDEVHVGANATIFTGTKDYSPAEWAEFQGWLDRVYVDFTSKVAEGRRLPKERVLQIAKGRIYTGEDAKALGLVDEVGGFPMALKLAKEAASIPESEGVYLRVFPAKKGTYEAFFGASPDSSEREATAAALAETLRAIQPVVQKLKAIEAGEKPAQLRMPAVKAKH